MLRVVWKFSLNVARIAMPRGAKLLHVGMQGGIPHVWAEVSPDADTVTRQFVIRGTGHGFGELIGGEYVGTVQGGAFVWHIYDRGEV